MFDCSEARRWMKQAAYTIESITLDLEGGFYSWACFKAHQAAEYSLKALLRGFGVESFGHDLLALWRKAKDLCESLNALWDCISLLNKMYIPPRYPDAWAGESAPYESYTLKDARDSHECARRVYESLEACIDEACKTPA